MSLFGGRFKDVDHGFSKQARRQAGRCARRRSISLLCSGLIGPPEASVARCTGCLSANDYKQGRTLLIMREAYRFQLGGSK